MHNAYDWQLIIAFYSLVQLANGHVNDAWKQSFATHQDVIKHLDVQNPTVSAHVNLGPEAHDAYLYLYNRSREARYLSTINDQGRLVQNSGAVSNIKFKTLKRGIEQLDRMCLKYSETYTDFVIPVTNIYMNGHLTGCKFFADLGDLPT